MGIHEKFLKEGIKITASNIYSAQKKRARVDLKRIQSPFSFVLSLEQSKTEKILAESLLEFGVEVERTTRLLSYAEKPGYIVAQTDKGVIEAKYLIGCDGAHSVVRKSMGCTFEGKTFRDIFSLADVNIQWKFPQHELSVFMESEGVLAAFPLPEVDRYRLIFQLKRLRGLYKPELAGAHGIIESDKIALPTLPEIQTLLSRYTQEKVVVSDPRWIANFHINSRLSNHYRKENIFLAGDAAHIHSPVGGQGMNTGIQDAFNLAWKIAYVHQSKAAASLLDTYEAERHHLGGQLLRATEKASMWATLHSPPLLFIRNHLLTTLLSKSAIQDKVVSLISEVNIRCPNKRAPDFTVLKEGKRESLYSICERSQTYTLLLFNTDGASLIHPNIQVLQVREESTPKALLVRPDGYIAVEDHPPFHQLKAYIAEYLSVPMEVS